MLKSWLPRRAAQREQLARRRCRGRGSSRRSSAPIMSLGEVVVAGRHRRVRREHGVRGDRLERRGEVEAALAHQRRAARSSTRNAACPSLMCQTVGLSPSAASARTPPTPSTISCSMRVVAVAAVEPVRDVAVGVAVLRQVGVEQVEPDVADARLPHLDARPSRPGSSTSTRSSAPSASRHRRDRQRRRSRSRSRSPAGCRRRRWSA